MHSRQCSYLNWEIHTLRRFLIATDEETSPDTAHQKLFPWSILENYNIGRDFLIGKEAGKPESTSTYKINLEWIQGTEHDVTGVRLQAPSVGDKNLQSGASGTALPP